MYPILLKNYGAISAYSSLLKMIFIILIQNKNQLINGNLL